MFKAWSEYTASFVPTITKMELPLVEKVMVAAVVLFMLTCTVHAYIGHDVGDVERLRLAKLQGQQGLVATGTPAESR